MNVIEKPKYRLPRPDVVTTIIVVNGLVMVLIGFLGTERSVDSALLGLLFLVVAFGRTLRAAYSDLRERIEGF